MAGDLPSIKYNSKEHEISYISPAISHFQRMVTFLTYPTYTVCLLIIIKSYISLIYIHAKFINNNY